jgi:nucleoid DNA-binding protein
VFSDRSRTELAVHTGVAMKREDLANKLARLAHLPEAAARDEVDALVHRILKALRKGRPVEFPGIGKLISLPVKREKR